MPRPALFIALLLLWPVALRAGDIRLPQADGSELVLAAPAQTMVTLAPNLAEIVFAAGAGDRLLATVEYSDYPPEAARLPRVGDAFRLDVEQILALRPDLVLAWESGNPRAAVAQLRQLGLNVWSVEVLEPQAIPELVAAVGRAAGTDGMAAATALELQNRLDALADRYAGAPQLRYFYQVEAKPLFTVNGRHLISRGLALCGGMNIFADATSLAFQAAREAVVLADPDAIFAPVTKAVADPLADWRNWPRLAAVRHGALFLLPADEISRATPRFLDSLEQSCKLLDDLRRRNPHD